MTPVYSNAQPHQPHLRAGHLGDGGCTHPWPTAMRTLLLLTEAVPPSDPALARLSDEELNLLRVVFARLNGGDPPSSIA
jgi:hypothetical protein